MSRTRDAETLAHTGDEKNLTEINVANIHQIEEDASLDAAGKFLAEQALLPDGEWLVSPYTPEEEAKVRRKADMIVMPLLAFSLTQVGVLCLAGFWLTYSFGAVDKVALGTAGVLSIRKDLNLVGQQYSWASSLIFFGQLISVFPALFLMQRFQTGKVVACNVVVWGILSLASASVQNFAGLAICRFLLGFFESLTYPGFSIIVAQWWTRPEQTVRVAVIYNVASTMFNGLISYGCSFINHDIIHQWRALFIITGAVTLVLGVTMLVFLPNAPMTAWWLTPRQRCIATMRLRANRTGISNKTFKKYQAKEALLDIKTWLIFFAFIGVSISNGGLSTFGSIVVNGFGFSTRETMLVQIPTGLFAWFLSIVFSYIAFKLGNRTVVAFFAAVLPLIGTIMLVTIPRSNLAGSMIGLYITWGYWAPYVLMQSQMVANTGGNTKKTVTYGITYFGYLIGNIIGPQTFLARQAPKYPGGIVAMLVGYCVSLFSIALYFLHLRRITRKKESELAEMDPLGAHEDDGLADWQDATDFENPRFKYHP